MPTIREQTPLRGRADGELSPILQLCSPRGVFHISIDQHGNQLSYKMGVQYPCGTIKRRVAVEEVVRDTGLQGSAQLWQLLVNYCGGRVACEELGNRVIGGDYSVVLSENGAAVAVKREELYHA